MTKQKISSKRKERTFEEALGRLEEIVLELEEGELSLEEALEKFEEGIDLSRFLTQKLTKAEEKIKKLVKTTKGEFRIEPLEIEE